ncbi:MAG: type III pantothenate kinase [bacterium]
MEFVSADLGNSRLKLLIDDDLLAFNLDNDFYDELIELIGDKEFAYSSVNRIAEEKLLEKLTANSVRIRKLTLDDIENLISLDGIEGMGLDRALGLAGALSLIIAPVITIDCGSALTVNILGKNSQFLGGIIMPGLITQAESLRRINPILYPTNFVKPTDKIPKNTNDNVMAGMINSLQGGVTKYLTEVFEELEWTKGNIPIFVTGGYRELIADELIAKGFNVQIHENLVTLGIKSIVNV